MARTSADLSTGTRITDYISLGVVTKSIPLSTVKSVLRSVQKLSRRERALPAHVVVYYVIALALYMQVAYREVLRCLLEGIQWLVNPNISHYMRNASYHPPGRPRWADPMGAPS